MIKNHKRVMVLYDWLGDLTPCELLSNSRVYLKEYFSSLTAKGIVKSGGKTSRYSHLSPGNFVEMSKVEVYGSARARRDLSEWDSYFLYTKSEISSTIIFSALPGMLKNELVFDFLEKISCTTNLGYGYMKDCSIDSNPIFEALGVTFGYPRTAEEAEIAARDSRWFEERLVMSGEKKMRHLRGKFRSVYEVNIINGDHLSVKIDGTSLREHLSVDPYYGKLLCLNNGSYIWTLPEKHVDRVRHEIYLAGGLI